MNISRRLTAVTATSCLLLGALGARVVALQVNDAETFTANAEKQRTRVVTLTGDRGEILDRNGAALVKNREVKIVFADPSEVDGVAATAEALGGILGLSQAELNEKLSGEGRYSVLARDVDLATARKVRELGLKGIGTISETVPEYPWGPAALSTVGTVNREGVGVTGVEAYLDEQLRGRDGLARYEVDPRGRKIPLAESVMTPAIPGSSVKLTLDRDISWYAQKVLADQVKATKSKGGALVTLDVKTGHVVAMATVGDGAVNRAVGMVYEPGSVNKIVTAAAAIETGKATPSSPIPVGAGIRVANKTFTDTHVLGGTWTFAGVIAKSSNVGTIRVAQKVGSASLYKFFRAFGYGQQTGIELPAESGGILANYRTWSSTQKATVAIGYGLAVTPLQMASVYATVANGGVRIPPRLVAETQGADGTWSAAESAKPSRVVSAKTAKQVNRMLEAVTNEGGTGTTAALAGYRVAGKTGTAFKRNDACGCYKGYYASFVGYAPADKPRLVTLVVMDDPVGAHYGGLVSAPVFQQVMTYALSKLAIPPTGTKAPFIALRPGDKPAIAPKESEGTVARRD